LIFITLGSQKFQFNRLLQMIDELVESNQIKDELFAQIGYSDYTPRNYKYKQFLDREEFVEMMQKCEKVITHGGTGAMVMALKNSKKVIAIPRLAKYNEHVDDHQVQIVMAFKDLNLIQQVTNKEELIEGLTAIENSSFDKFESSTRKIINSIEMFIGGEDS